MQKKISLSDSIFIAGASGMAGSAIFRALQLKGYGSNKYGGQILTPSRKELNLTNGQEVKRWFDINKPSVVILAAAKVGGILANKNYPVDFLLENLKIQTNTIESSWQSGVKRLLFLGSSCIYPKLTEQPIREESLLSGKLESTNEWYAIAKIAGIKLCEALRIQHGFDAISLMPTNLYGPGDNYHPTDSHVFASLVKKFCDAKKYSYKKVTCWGTGRPMREFMHVDDLGRAVVFALEHWDPSKSNAPLDESNNPLLHINVGTGKDISIFDLANKIAKYTNYEGEIVWDKNKPDGTPKKLLNVDKFKSLGWESEIELDDGIKSTIKEVMQNNI